jgi:cell division protein FtsB
MIMETATVNGAINQNDKAAVTSSSITRTVTSTGATTSYLSELAESQKKVVALQWELQMSHNVSHAQASALRRQMQKLEGEIDDLKDEKATLNDRHDSHMEELTFLQCQLFMVHRHLVKLKNEVEQFQESLGTGGFWGTRSKSNSQTETCERLQIRQEGTIIVLENTIGSLKEILEEYVPLKAPAVDILPEAGVGLGLKVDEPKEKQYDALPLPSSRPPLASGENHSGLLSSGGLLASFQRQFSSRRGMSSPSPSTKNLDDVVNDVVQEEDRMGNFVSELFKANQIHFAQYMHQSGGTRRFSEFDKEIPVSAVQEDEDDDDDDEDDDDDDDDDDDYDEKEHLNLKTRKRDSTSSSNSNDNTQSYLIEGALKKRSSVFEQITGIFTGIQEDDDDGKEKDINALVRQYRKSLIKENGDS